MIHFDHNQHSSPPSPHQANHPSDHNNIHAWSGDQEHQYRPSTSQRHSPTHRPSAVSTTTNSPSATSPAALAKDASSRQSTPLSELSPPPDDDEEPSNVKEEDTEPKQVPSSPASQPTPSLDIKSPTLSRAGSTSASPDPKIVLILELNSELLKVCMDFQAQGVALAEPRYASYSSRLQSNLTWLASVANQRQANPSGGPVPIMEPPQIIHDSPSSVRIQNMYSELAQRFARIIARHQQHQLVMPSFNNGHKRERTEDMSDMPLHKRRHTGETKMMPPPVPGMNRDGLSNGHPPSSSTPVLDPGSSNAGNADAMRERTRAAQLRAAQMQQQQRQMSPASGAGPGGAPGGPAGMGTGNGMPPRGLPSQLANAPPIYQQAWQMSQNPNHPFMQQVLSNVPNLQTLPVAQQLTKIVQFINLRQQQMQQRAQMGGDNLSAGGLSGNMGGAAGAGMGSPSISGMMPGSPGGGMSAMNQQRQMMMMQQAQARSGLNPQQQQLLLQQQERMRMEQERQRMAANGGQQSPAMSPGAAPEFAALRSNAGLPGIARSTRSPSDGAPSPMTPRVRNSANPEEMQRMMMQRGGPNPGLPSQFGGGGIGGGIGGGVGGGMSGAMGNGMGGGGLGGGVGGGMGGINGLGGMGGSMGGGPGGFGMPGRPSSAMGASSPTGWSNGDLGFNDGMGVLGGGRSQQSPGGGGMDLSSMGGDLGDFNWNQ